MPGSLIVPDSKPPSVFLLGAGALLLAGLVIRTLRRCRSRRASRQGSSRGASRGATILGSWQPVVPRAEVLLPLADTQKRGRAAKKRP